MSTRSQNKVVPSSTTPNMAVHPAGSGTGVPGPVPGVPVTASGPQLIAAPDRGAVTGVKTVREGINALLAVFAQHLRTPTSDFTRHGKVSAQRVAVTALLVQLLRDHPSLASIDPADIDVGAANADAMDLLAATLQALLTRVQDTSRMIRYDVWFQCHAVYISAGHQAKLDKAMVTALAPVKAALARGKRTDTGLMATAAASNAATKAQNRATAAQHRAVATTQSHTRAVQAHAANTTVRGTSPVPLANPQGPAASADVAPQGPAPGR